MTTRVAAVDIGTNSTRVLIAEKIDGAIRDMERIGIVTALGRGVDESGSLAPDAVDRTVDALERYGRLIRDHGVIAARAVATSASRDAANRDDFFDAAQRALGFRPEVISGSEEARLSYLGATAGVPGPGGLVIDIGGGSTEFVVDSGGVSIDIGSVRLTERCLANHPASPVELNSARAEAARMIATRNLPADTWAIGVAGTWTSLAAMHLELDVYDSSSVEGAVMMLDDVRHLVNWLASLTLAEKQSIPSLDANRSPVILGGAVVAEASLQALAIDRVTVSEHDILDGICMVLKPDS